MASRRTAEPSPTDHNQILVPIASATGSKLERRTDIGELTQKWGWSGHATVRSGLESVAVRRMRGSLTAGFVLMLPVPIGGVAALALAIGGLPHRARGVAGARQTAIAHHGTGRARSRSIEIGWVGDVTPGSRYGIPSDDSRSLFAETRALLTAPDLMAGNLEGTLSQGGISKCGAITTGLTCFAFQAPPGNATGLAASGFDLFNLANNHAFDFGVDGERQTLVALAQAGIAVSGMPGQIRMLERRGTRLAFVGFAPYPWAASLTDLPAAAALVREAGQFADVVVVMIHAGAEGSDQSHTPQGAETYLGEPRGSAREFAHAMVDAGADLVLGSGPHVLRGMEMYRSRLIAYSLGNFAGVHNFSTAGNLALSALLDVRIDRTGRFVNGWLHPLRMVGGGTPQPDPGRAAIQFVRDLSTSDFGAAAPRVLASGRVLPAGDQDATKRG